MFSADINTEEVTALVDTGAEICLVRRGLLDGDYFKMSEKPIALIAANGQQLSCGDREVEMILQARAENPVNMEKALVEVPVKAFEAAIDYDLILAYEWLAKYDLLLYAKANALIVLGKPARWIWGVNAQRAKYQEIICMEGAQKEKLMDACYVIELKGVIIPKAHQKQKIGESEVVEEERHCRTREKKIRLLKVMALDSGEN